MKFVKNSGVLIGKQNCLQYEFFLTFITDCIALSYTCSTHINEGLDGVEIIVNGSGSHSELRKLNITDDLIKSATYKVCHNFFRFSLANSD